MKAIVVLTILWNCSALALTKPEQDDIFTEQNNRDIHFTVGAFKNDKFRRTSEFVPAKGHSGIRKLISFTDPLEANKFDIVSKYEGDIDLTTVSNHDSSDDLVKKSSHKIDASNRYKRSSEISNREALRQMIFDLYETLKDPQNYRNLLAIIGALQEELEDNPHPSGRSALLQNLLNTIMKRRFSSWGGKRDSQVEALTPGLGDQQTRSNFYAWGGRRKKSAPTRDRGRRRFSAWGGKRGGNDGVLVTARAVLAGINSDSDKVDTDLRLTEASDVTDLLWPGDSGRQDMNGEQPGAAWFPQEVFPKRHSFNAWGGKRSGYGQPLLNEEQDGSYWLSDFGDEDK